MKVIQYSVLGMTQFQEKVDQDYLDVYLSQDEALELCSHLLQQVRQKTPPRKYVLQEYKDIITHRKNKPMLTFKVEKENDNEEH